MNLSGIGPSFHIKEKDSIKESVSLGKSEITSLNQTESKNQEQQETATNVDQTFTSYNFAGLYPYDQTLPPRGDDADLSKLDVEKAISDMEKDRILQQYQFFVK